MKRIAKVVLTGALLLALFRLQAAAQWGPDGKPLNIGRKPPPEDQSPGRDSLDRAFPWGKPGAASP